MNCFECAAERATTAAVATCHHCGVGLCLEHLSEAHEYRVGGTLYGCPHDFGARAPLAPVSEVEQRTNGHKRVPAGLWR